MQNKAQASQGRQSSKENRRLATVATRYTLPHPPAAKAKGYSKKLSHDRAFVSEPTD